MMNAIKELAGDTLKDLAHQGGEFVKNSLYDAAIDALTDTYSKLLKKWAVRYLDYSGSDPELLKRHRRKFMRIARMTTTAISEVDCYVVGHYRNIWSEIVPLLEPRQKRARPEEDENDVA